MKQKTDKSLKFAIFGNIYQPKKSTSVQKLLCLLEEAGFGMAIDRDFYIFLTETMQLCVHADELIDYNDFDADFVISMGGDGTFLKAASRVQDKNIPIVGINMGRLGFLAEVSPEDIEKCIMDIIHGEYSIEERNLLKVKLINATSGEELTPEYDCALNDVAILKHDSSSMISIRTDIDDSYLTTYQSDGIVICTPTGSTAYSLSVGGPIMEPLTGTIGINPVAPHSLNVRPVVLKDDCIIRLQVSSRSHNFLVSIDGRSISCGEDVEVQICKAPYQIKVLKRKGSHFFQTLRQKMMWGADNRD